jgi:hypothetical protein
MRLSGRDESTVRTNVTFQHPAEFVPVSEDEGILSVAGVAWFLELLARVEGIEVVGDPIQEDWGVVAFARRGDCRFWIGISFWDEGAWLVHVHHHSSAWLQRMSSKGKTGLSDLCSELHKALKSAEGVREVSWHVESDLRRPGVSGAATPDAA